MYKTHPTRRRHTHARLRPLLAGSCLLAASPLFAQSSAELEDEVAQLRARLAEAEAALSQAQSTEAAAVQRAEDAEQQLDLAADTGPSKIVVGPFSIGGAIRANYTLGDYPNGGAPSRGGDGGNISLDTFRINVDFAQDNWLGKAEYRWYDGYNFLHTGWVGYQFENDDVLQVGLNRVPFGPGAYGVSQSWFFDQHYYVGLSDDMDIGAKYSGVRDNVSFDLAAYIAGDGQWKGASSESARYSYDVVNESGEGYKEAGQLNARVIVSTELGEATVDYGASLQYGLLESDGPQDDGSHYAASIHAVAKQGNWTLAPQLTYYKYDIDPHEVQSGAVTDELIDMGAYDFAWPVAAEAWVGAISLSYYHATPELDWLDYVIPYIEYSSIMKTADGFNNSDLFVIGAAWGRGGWYIYTDYALSDGNYFVGGDDFTTFGANPNDDWQYRLNVNFGYYF
ncbi:MAG: hypothetical protein ACLFR7_02360 [Opitutales bacterium]